MAPILYPLTGRWATEVESLQSSHFSTGPPTWGPIELSNCKSTPIYKPESQFFFFIRLGGSFTFCDAGPRFGAKLVLRPTQPHNEHLNTIELIAL